MTATITSDLDAFIASLPGNLEAKILRPALKAGVDVIADGAREECRSEEVRATIKTSSRAETGLVTAKVETKGPGAHKAPWLEHGTDPHFISVDDEQRGGMTISRINRDEDKKASLVIGGQFVGGTVHHPGAQAHPFMRPAADTRGPAAIEAIGAAISKRLTKASLAGPAPADPDEE